MVEFATTADGVSVGFERFGEGPVIVRRCGAGETVSMFTQEATPTFARFVAALSGVCTLVCSDRRGTGWSDRTAIDCSVPAAVADLAAVIDAVSDGPVAVVGAWEQAVVAIEFAKSHPERVSHLVFVQPVINGPAYLDTPLARSLMAVLDQDWELYLRFVVRVTNSVGGRLARHYESLFRTDLSPEYLRAFFDAADGFVIDDETMAAVQAPSLVVQQTNFNAADLSAVGARRLAAGLPNARLLQGDNWEELGDGIVSFIGATPPDRDHGGFRAIMFTDLVGSTALTQQLGDAGAQAIIDQHDRAVDSALDSNSGVRIKHTGDGVMAGFASAVHASRAARAIVTDLDAAGIGVRVGLNAGEPIARDGDLFGSAVQLAARVCDRADAGQVLATGVIRELTAGKDLTWTAQGDFEPKGFDRPVETYALDMS